MTKRQLASLAALLAMLLMAFTIAAWYDRKARAAQPQPLATTSRIQLIDAKKHRNGLDYVYTYVLRDTATGQEFVATSTGGDGVSVVLLPSCPPTTQP